MTGREPQPASPPNPARPPAPSRAADAVIVLMGGAGDLAARRVIPAAFAMWRQGLLGPRSEIVGMGRRRLGDDAYRDFLADQGSGEPGFSRPAWDGFAGRVSYLQGDAADPACYAELARRHFSDPAVNGLFYLACVPERFGDAARLIAEAGLAGRGHRFGIPPSGQARSGAAAARAGVTAPGFRRLAVEKPFGVDLASARALNRLLHERYDEADIFRVDHYLGKDSTQNLLSFRFGEASLEPVWNASFIERVEISAAESGGIGSRGGYYDRAGAVRDMIQSHLMQLMCLVAMERPDGFSREAVRGEKVRVLRSAACAFPKDCLRGQYARNEALGLPGYRDEPFVARDSTTETFAAVRLTLDTPRWRGVPFILRSGKALETAGTEIRVTFRQTVPSGPRGERLSLGLRLDGAGEPGPLRGKAGPYVRLISAALAGEPALFPRFDEVEEAWRILDPVLEAWKRAPRLGLEFYPAGGGGPDMGSLRVPQVETPAGIPATATASETGDRVEPAAFGA